MGREYLVIDPHGGHSNAHPGVDDGATSPQEMVLAAKGKQIIPAITGHNTLRGVASYLEIMDLVGWKKVSLPGIEFGYRVPAIDLDGLESTHDYLIRVTPERMVCTKECSSKLPCGEITCATGADETRNHLIERTGSVLELLMGQVVDIPRFNLKDPVGFSADRKMNDALQLATGWMGAVGNPGFSRFYSRFYGRDLVQGIDRSAEDELVRVTTLGYYYAALERSLRRNDLNKGEIICLMPPNKDLLDKMSLVAERWREEDHYKKESLTSLFNFLDGRLSQTELDSVVWHLPHPVSIDSALFGKLIVRLREGKVRMFSPEIFLPEVAREIDTLEVLNAAHPGACNGLSNQIAELDLFKNKGKVGVSDSHHPCWVGSGATLVEVDEKTSEGILAALKKGKTVPLSGWGELSRTWFPFFAWMGVSLAGKKGLLPDFVSRRIYNATDVWIPAEKAIADKVLEK